RLTPNGACLSGRVAFIPSVRRQTSAKICDFAWAGTSQRYSDTRLSPGSREGRQGVHPHSKLPLGGSAKLLLLRCCTRASCCSAMRRGIGHSIQASAWAGCLLSGIRGSLHNPGPTQSNHFGRTKGSCLAVASLQHRRTYPGSTEPASKGHPLGITGACAIDGQGSEGENLSDVAGNGRPVVRANAAAAATVRSTCVCESIWRTTHSIRFSLPIATVCSSCCQACADARKKTGDASRVQTYDCGSTGF